MSAMDTSVIVLMGLVLVHFCLGVINRELRKMDDEE